MSSRATIRAGYVQSTNIAGGYEPAPHAHEHDPALIRQAQAGNAAAFEKLAAAYDRAILSFLMALTASEKDALELCHATLLSAYQELGSRRTCSMYIWLHRVAAAQWLAWTRKAAFRAAASQLGASGSDSRCAQALTQLSERERLVFTLKACRRLTLRTVAQILEEPEETLGRTFTRAVCKLQLAMRESR